MQKCLICLNRAMSWANFRTPRQAVPKNLGEAVRKRRREAKWTQARLAAETGVSLKTVQRIERTGRASVETVDRIAQAFGLEIVSLVEGWRPTRKSFGARVRAKRIARGITIRELADHFGVNECKWSRMERDLGPVDCNDFWRGLIDPDLARYLGFMTPEPLMVYLAGDDLKRQIDV